MAVGVPASAAVTATGMVVRGVIVLLEGVIVSRVPVAHDALPKGWRLPGRGAEEVTVGRYPSRPNPCLGPVLVPIRLVRK